MKNDYKILKLYVYKFKTKSIDTVMTPESTLLNLFNFSEFKLCYDDVTSKWFISHKSNWTFRLGSRIFLAAVRSTGTNPKRWGHRFAVTISTLFTMVQTPKYLSFDFRTTQTFMSPVNKIYIERYNSCMNQNCLRFNFNYKKKKE